MCKYEKLLVGDDPGSNFSCLDYFAVFGILVGSETFTSAFFRYFRFFPAV